MVSFPAALVQSTLALTGPNARNLTQLFGPSLSAEAQIIFPTTPQWDTNVRQRWSVYQEPTYLGAIKPATTSDIQEVIKIADANEIPFFATGGGHGISDYSAFEGITIDLGNFKAVHLNETTNHLTVGAATEYSQLGDLLYNAGKELPLASCPCVGVVGATLGAGIGPLVGLRGPMLDALESVDVVTADGSLVTASATRNPDLFWALRGAGFNFGIVVSATYRVFDITNGGQVMMADLIFPASANRSVWETLQLFDDVLSAKLAITVVAVYNREIEQPVIVVHAVYFGPQTDGEKLLQPFRDLGPLVSNIGMVQQNEMFPADHGACVPNQRINLYTVAFRQTDPPSLESYYAHLVDMWQSWPDYDGRLLIMRYATDTALTVPDSDTAYPWRDAIAHMNLENFYTDPAHDKHINELVVSARERFSSSSGYSSLATYSNFAHGDEGPESWYSARKLPRLSATKRIWDPKGLFSWHNPVPRHWKRPETEL
ncbi:putative FAD-binding PCMH-type domain-containing protein [Seiridium cardinale]|uniref:FAD-binding PCMH-type domain-containing protein n=1 Tax=Seiridium cardinale TaxID=138064 RepID=A0ABR2XH37_9PEZI